MAGIQAKVSTFIRDTNPYYASGDSLPALPTFLKEEDPEGFKKYDREIREWWTQVQENLDKLQDKIFEYKLKDLEERTVTATSTLDSVTTAGLSTIDRKVSEVEAMLYSKPD
jgi:hypothetical protein